MAVDVKLMDRNGNELNVGGNLYTYYVSMSYYNEEQEQEAYIYLEFTSSKKITNSMESIFNLLPDISYKTCYITDNYNGEIGSGIIYRNGDNIWFETQTQNLTVDEPYNSGHFSIFEFCEMPM